MGRTVISKTENKQIVILSDTPEGVTGGYYDQEDVWHDFGGGAVNITPTITITAVNSIAENYSITPEDDAFLKIENNHLMFYGGSSFAVEYGETKVFESIISVNSFGFFGFGIEDKLWAGDGVIFNSSNLVNCSINERGLLLITDPTQNASCTLTFTLSE